MTEGQTPAGWYDDGQGQLRWYDGTAWTEHVQPLPAPAAPVAPAPVAQPVAAPVAPQVAQAAPAAPVAPVAPVAQPAQTVTPGGAAIGAPGSHGHGGDPWAEPVPIYRKPWFLIAAAVLLVAVIGAAIALSLGGSDDDAGTAGATNTPAATTGTNATPAPGGAAGGAAAFGADAATVAARAGCAVSATLPATPSDAIGSEPSSKVACTLGDTLYTVVTWASAADQTGEGSLAKAFTQPVTAGTKYYATGEGWTAFDTTYDQAAATTFATAAGGSVKGVVVVLASPGATP